MTPRAYSFCIVGCVLAALLLAGCGAVDELRCGDRLLEYRDGYCRGFGSNGFVWKTLDPNVARELAKGTP